ncbi:MAG: DUF4020 domain-containing protein [Chloroflexi bacterium]|nr:DUF4020 domain-containing protein [Chloroflexota bacterium]
MITTNFDKHFAAAAAQLFGEPCQLFCAPALPLGHEFAGIVHLHGAVDNCRSLVLTDEDFGRAYLTEGWATRFLQGVFARYTVLFVGYSHGDPVMHYLARGLTPGSQKPRFAFTPEGTHKPWEFLGITPITYQLKKGRKKHARLDESIGAWVELRKRGTLDHEHCIHSLVTKPPPLDDESADYLERALKDLPSATFFTRYARGPEWLQWAETRHAFDALFQPSDRPDEIAQVISQWFVDCYVFEYPDQALALVCRHPQQLNPALWTAIARRLASHSSTQPEPAPEVLARWFAVLVVSPKPRFRQDWLEWALGDCNPAQNGVIALLLFEHLTRPHLDLKVGPRFSREGAVTGESIDAELALEGDPYWLTKSWDEVFRPNLAAFAERLEAVVRCHLQQAHMLLRSVGRANGLADPTSMWRSAIELHEQDQHRTPIDVLVDAARDVLEWFVTQRPDRGRAVIEAWGDAEAPLLRRLAVHGITEDANLTPDEKIAWVVRRGWLYATGLKHEVFRLVKVAYPNASEHSRSTFLAEVESGPARPAADGPDEGRRQYVVYNLLFWIHRAAPDCPLASTRFGAMQDAHPEFAPRESPDLDAKMQFFWGVRSPVSVDELLACDLAEKVDWLLTYQGETFMGPDREGLLVTVTKAVSTKCEWGWELALTLQKAKAWATDLWAAILRGWGEGCLAGEQWSEILTLLQFSTLPDGPDKRIAEVPEVLPPFPIGRELRCFVGPMCDLLKDGISKRECAIPSQLIPLAETVSEQLWQEVAEASNEEVTGEDWLQIAINNPSGILVEFWLHALSRVRAEAAIDWNGIPEAYKDRFEKVIQGPSQAAELGRVILASQVHFLYTLDASWVRSSVLPLLDWSVYPGRAAQCWNGFLTWGQWSEDLLPDLIPLYRKTFAHVADLGDMRHRLSEHLANIAVFGSSHPLHEDWLKSFLLEVEPEDRIRWASQLGFALRSLDDGSAQHLWNRWLAKYWNQRITGVPLPLAPDEAEEMIEWSVNLEPVFAEVVERICRSPAPILRESSHRLFRQLDKKDYAVKYPAALTRLLRHLLPLARQPFWGCPAVEQMVRKLANSMVPRQELRQICDEMARLGCANAADVDQSLS